MDIVVAILIGIVGSLIAAEFYANGPAIAEAMIRRAVLRLAEDERPRRVEEWLADNADFAGNIGKIFHACGCIRASRKLKSSSVRKEQNSRKLRLSLAFKLNRNFHMLGNFFIERFLPKYWVKTKSIAIRPALSRRYNAIVLEEEIEKRLRFIQQRNKRYVSIKLLYLRTNRVKAKPKIAN